MEQFITKAFLLLTEYIEHLFIFTVAGNEYGCDLGRFDYIGGLIGQSTESGNAASFDILIHLVEPIT